jgi:trehalose/maltose hydrolase-like predicted phosphorylase
VAATTGGITAAGVQSRQVRRDAPAGAASTHAVVDRVVAVRAGTDAPPAPDVVAARAAEEAATGFDRLLASHRRAWADRWDHADVTIEGDDRLQAAVRFALFHLMGSVADSGEAAVGPRGLTGPGYSGHVFWDADAFVLPFLAATHPDSARAMLEYRLRRLPAALAAARAIGRQGARFPWESARTGEDVTPPSAHDRTGRLVPIRTGQLEEHIVAQVALAADTYVEWTGDEEFASGPFRTLLASTARYWASRIRVDADGTGHIFGVIGPDEYHEPVDDNACTNVLARWNLRRAAGLLDVDPDGVGPEERARWLELAAGLYDGYDGDTGIYEQFVGFHRLEPLIIAEAAPRRPIAADLLLGAARTHGAQVIKQADVLMLHHLVPDEVVPGSLEPNLRFYEPRTAHGSSLSPAVYASLQARVRDFGPALEALRTAALLDLDDLTGSSSGGLHLATMGGLWQALAFGFAGLRARSGRLHVDPVLPPQWSGLELRVRFRGTAVHLRKERSRLRLTVDRRTSLVVGRTSRPLGPGTFEFRRRGPDWELVP